MKKVIGLKEFRNNVDAWISHVKNGHSVVVLKRSQPVFQIISPEEDSELWETVADFTEINKNGVSAKKILASLRKLNANS